MRSVLLSPRWTSLIAWAVLLAAPLTASAQLRVVNYNTLDKPSDAADIDQLRTIFGAVANTARNGVAKRPDVVGLQEQAVISGSESTASVIAAEFNDLYGVSSYSFQLFGTGSDRLGVVYDTSTVSLVATGSVFTTGPRQTYRVEFQPVGYSSEQAAFHTYISHFKAGSTSSDVATRTQEGLRVRLNADQLGEGANVVYMGDFNLYSQNEAGYQNLTAAGPAQAFDPVALSSWPNSSVARYLTQSTRTTSIGDGGATGGIDDRFDLQLVTNALLDGEGLSYLGPTSAGLSSLLHSYQAFGNDGNTYNQAINSNLSGRSQPAAVLNALHGFSDHLPVVADYQLPAMLGYVLDDVPLTLEQGEVFSLGLTVSNAANVVAAAGADELDFSVSTSGAISGAFAGIAAALSAGFDYELALDTSTLGLRTGMLTLSSLSQAAENSLVQIPISFQVIAAALAGDYNGDNVVDAADYTVWRDGGWPDTSQAAYDTWAANYGATAAPTTSTAVPEPTAVVLAIVALAGLVKRRL